MLQYFMHNVTVDVCIAELHKNTDAYYISVNTYIFREFSGFAFKHIKYFNKYKRLDNLCS